TGVQTFALPISIAFTHVAFIAAGCTTTPTAPPALDLPAGTGVDPALERWWTDFNDPTLTALVDEALTHSQYLRAAIARIDLARTQDRCARSRRANPDCASAPRRR